MFRGGPIFWSQERLCGGYRGDSVTRYNGERAIQWHAVSRVAGINMSDVKVELILSCSPVVTQNKGHAQIPIDINSL